MMPSVPKSVDYQMFVWWIMGKMLTLETSLTPTEEIEEQQARGNVNTDTLGCEFDHVRDGNIDKDSNRDPRGGNWYEGGEMDRTGRRLSFGGGSVVMEHLLWVDRDENTCSKATGTLRQRERCETDEEKPGVG